MPDNLIITNLLGPIYSKINSAPYLRDSALLDELLEMMDIFKNPSDVSGCLSHGAMTPEKSLGRKSWNSPDLVWLELGHNDWQIDQITIAESKSLRRLGKKAQVQYKTNSKISGFTKQLNPHVGDRLTHSLGVASDSINLCQATGLCTDLGQAGGMGHDLGHGPFSHTSDYYINDELKKEGRPKFSHALFSVEVLQNYERDDLEHANLTLETYLTIAMHSEYLPTTENIAKLPWECFTNNRGDKINYIFRDSKDATRSYLPELQRLAFPKEYYQLGSSQRQRNMLCKLAIIKECYKARQPSEGDSFILKLMAQYRDWLFANIYHMLNASPTRKETRHDLERAREWLQKEFSEYDSLLLLALCTDDEVLIMSQSIARKKEVPKAIRNTFSINEIIHRLPKGLHVFGSNVDLDPNHYSKR